MNKINKEENKQQPNKFDTDGVDLMKTLTTTKINLVTLLQGNKLQYKQKCTTGTV